MSWSFYDLDKKETKFNIYVIQCSDYNSLPRWYVFVAGKIDEAWSARARPALSIGTIYKESIVQRLIETKIFKITEHTEYSRISFQNFSTNKEYHDEYILDNIESKQYNKLPKKLSWENLSTIW